MVWTQEEIDAFKSEVANREGNAGKVNDFVNAAQGPSGGGRRISSTSRQMTSLKSPNPSSEDNSHLRSPEWLGRGTPTGQRRSWKVNSVRDVVPEVPDIMED